MRYEISINTVKIRLKQNLISKRNLSCTNGLFFKKYYNYFKECNNEKNYISPNKTGSPNENNFISSGIENNNENLDFIDPVWADNIEINKSPLHSNDNTVIENVSNLPWHEDNKQIELEFAYNNNMPLSEKNHINNGMNNDEVENFAFEFPQDPLDEFLKTNEKSNFNVNSRQDSVSNGFKKSLSEFSNTIDDAILNEIDNIDQFGNEKTIETPKLDSIDFSSLLQENKSSESENITDELNKQSFNLENGLKQKNDNKISKPLLSNQQDMSQVNKSLASILDDILLKSKVKNIKNSNNIQKNNLNFKSQKIKNDKTNKFLDNLINSDEGKKSKFVSNLENNKSLNSQDEMFKILEQLYLNNKNETNNEIKNKFDSFEDNNNEIINDSIKQVVNNKIFMSKKKKIGELDEEYENAVKRKSTKECQEIINLLRTVESKKIINQIMYEYVFGCMSSNNLVQKNLSEMISFNGNNSKETLKKESLDEQDIKRKVTDLKQFEKKCTSESVIEYFPEALHEAMVLLREKFNSPNEAFALFVYSRQIGNKAFIKGCSLPIYIEAMRSSWCTDENLNIIYHIGTEIHKYVMDKSSTFNVELLMLIDDILKDVKSDMEGETEYSIQDVRILDVLKKWKKLMIE